MRFSILALAVLAIATPASSQGPSYAPAVVTTGEPQGDNCRKPTNYHAENVSSYHGERVQPRKLTELPSGAAYMAVYRTIDGCEEPMTLTEYRSGQQR